MKIEGGIYHARAFRRKTGSGLQHGDGIRRRHTIRLDFVIRLQRKMARIVLLSARFHFRLPVEITALSHAAEAFRKLDTEILGVSVDSIHSHRAWINTPVENNGLGPLNFPLASDITKNVARDYGVLIEEEGVALRGLFIIDPEGELKYQVVNHNDVGRSVDETLRVLQALQSGGLCPMNWKPGDKHLVAK